MNGNDAHINNEKRNEAARKRWKILAQALQKNGKQAYDISVCRITSFDLIMSRHLEHLQNFGDPKASWFEYSTTILQNLFSIVVRFPRRSFTAEELMGFNNTGNVCIWPSEEVLAYHLLCNLEFVAGKSVLELGGGLTCLAGLMLAKYSDLSHIDVTDGNVQVVDNVYYIIEKNNLLGKVSCSVLQWQNFQSFSQDYDIILSADCLFFDDSRKDLVEMMWTALNKDGIALVMAPRRAGTLEKFTQDARERGFSCNLQLVYNEQVWARHLELKNNPDYDEDIHYPLLLQLRKAIC